MIPNQSFFVPIALAAALGIFTTDVRAADQTPYPDWSQGSWARARDRDKKGGNWVYHCIKPE